MSTPNPEPDNGSRKLRLLALALLIGVSVGLGGLLYPMVTARNPHAAQAAAPSPPPTPTATKPSPSVTPVKPTVKPAQPVKVNDPDCLKKPATPVVYFTYVTAKKESATAFGTSLVPPGLQPGRATVTNAQWVTNNFWARLCHDPSLAAATRGSFDRDWNLAGSRAETLRYIAAAGKWSKTKLWYGTAPVGSWTYTMEDRRPRAPMLHAVHFNVRPSWYLIVPTPNGHEVMFRLECGGQAVVNDLGLNLYILG